LMKIRNFKKKYQEDIAYQLSWYAVSDSFRCCEFLVCDCCWQCETQKMRFVFPAATGIFEIDDFLDFCREYQPNFFRPMTEKTAMEYADSFDVMDHKPSSDFIRKKAAMISGDED